MANSEKKDQKKYSEIASASFPSATLASFRSSFIPLSIKKKKQPFLFGKKRKREPLNPSLGLITISGNFDAFIKTILHSLQRSKQHLKV